MGYADQRANVERKFYLEQEQEEEERESKAKLWKAISSINYQLAELHERLEKLENA